MKRMENGISNDKILKVFDDLFKQLDENKTYDMSIVDVFNSFLKENDIKKKKK